MASQDVVQLGAATQVEGPPCLPSALPYILDGHQIMGRTVRLYLQLSYPGVVSPSDHNLYFEGGKEPKVWEPTLNRVGLVWLTLEGKNKLLRIIHLQSYTFYLAFTEPGSGASAAKEFSAAFTRHSPGTVELLASRPKNYAQLHGARRMESI